MNRQSTRASCAILLTIAPAAFADNLTDQLDHFRQDILREECAPLAGFITYEELAQRLCDEPDPAAQRLGAFLLERIATVVGGTVTRGDKASA